MQVKMSIVNNRFRCGNFIRKIATDKDYGLISNVKLQRISFLVWHLEFDVEMKEK